MKKFKQIGPLRILVGEDGSRPPFSTTILIQGNQGDALIDCGSGYPVFDYLQKEHQVKEVLLTHYHLDHIWGVYLFPDAMKRINELDQPKLAHFHELGKASGDYAVLSEEERDSRIKSRKEQQIVPNMGPAWRPVMGMVNSIYPYNQPFKVAGTKVIMIHAPGHCEGFCCPYFVDHGVLHVGDFDLTSFGPWYCDADSDIDAFIRSAKQTLDVDAHYYVTSHHKGIIVGKQEYKRRLDAYLSVIDRRDEKLLRLIRKGVPVDQWTWQEIFYLQRHHHHMPKLMRYEKIGIAKQLKHLMACGEDLQDYYEEYLREHAIHSEWIHYRGDTGSSGRV